MEQSTDVGVKTGTRRILAIGAFLVGAAVIAAGIISFPRFLSSDKQVSRSQALKVTDVTRAFADIDQYGSFAPLTFRAGANTVYQLDARVGHDESPTNTTSAGDLAIIRTSTGPGTNSTNLWQELVLPKSADATTPFTIEDPLTYGLTTQMVVVRYRTSGDRTDRFLTVCIGQTDVTKVYVGRDGSTFTDAKLRNRTTTEACPSIIGRAFRPTKITGGTVIAEPSTLNTELEWNFVRFFIGLARFTRFSEYQTPDGEVPFVALPSDTPLYAGVNAPVNETTPNAVFRIEAETNSTSSSLTVCFPSLTVNPNTGGPVYYFDVEGTPYNDIMLQNRAMTESCPALVSRMLLLPEISNGQTSPSFPETNAVGVANRGAWVGITNGTLWHPVNNSPARNVSHPLILFLVGSNEPVTIPTTAVTLTDANTRTSRLCFLGGANAVVTSWDFVYYYDAALRPYRDMFLTNAVQCTFPTSGGGAAPSRLPASDGPNPLVLE